MSAEDWIFNEMAVSRRNTAEDFAAGVVDVFVGGFFLAQSMAFGLGSVAKGREITRHPMKRTCHRYQSDGSASGISDGPSARANPRGRSSRSPPIT